MESYKYVAFRATSEGSAFPRDTGSENTYTVIDWDYQRLYPGETTVFEPCVEVWIPEGYEGHLGTNDLLSDNRDIQVEKRYLCGGKWHPLTFSVKFLGSEEGALGCRSRKVYGERDLALLTIVSAKAPEAKA